MKFSFTKMLAVCCSLFAFTLIYQSASAQCVTTPPSCVDVSGPAYSDVITFDPFCCDFEWDEFCQAAYDELSESCGGPSTGCAAIPPSCVDTESTAYTSVILEDPFCCDTFWDSVCQGAYDELNDSCDPAAGCAETPVCVLTGSVAYETVTANDPSCCDVTWSGACQDAYDALSNSCTGACVAAPACVDTEGADYATVIGADPFCCNVEWDTVCQGQYDTLNDSCIDCPGVGNFGEACDDGNPNTFGSTIDENCDCTGGQVAAGNQLCAGAINLGCGATVTGSTVGAAPDVAPLCGTNDGTGGGVWYRYAGANPADVTLTTCSPNSNFDTKIRVYQGTCSELVCVAGNDDAACPTLSTLSTVTFEAQAATLYYILVHGFGSAEGEFELSLSCEVFDCPDKSNFGDPCVLPLPGGNAFALNVNDVEVLGSPTTFEDNATRTFEITAPQAGLYNLTIDVDGVASNGNWASEFRTRIIDPNGVNILDGAPDGLPDEWQPSVIAAGGPFTGSLTLEGLDVAAGTYTIEVRMSFDEGPTINGIVDYTFNFIQTQAGEINESCECAPVDAGCTASGGTLVWEGNRSFCVGTGTPKGINIAVTGASGTFQRWGLFNSAGQLVDSRGSNSQFNLDTYAPGDYTIRYIRYEADVDITQITSLASINTLEGCFGTSNAISVFLRPEPDAGTLTALSPTTVCANAGPSTGIQLGLAGFNAENRRYVITSQALGNQVVLQATGTATNATFNLNGLPAGTYRAAALGFQQGVNLTGVQFQSQLQGCFDLSNIVTISIVACLTADLSSSPNPTPGQSFVTFTNPREEYATLEVYDMSGRMVERLFNQVTTPDQEYRLEFNGGNLPNGVYLYRLTTDSEVIVEKFMIAR